MEADSRRGRKLPEASPAPRPRSAPPAGDGRSPAFDAAAGLLWLVLLWAWITPIAGMSDWTEPAQTGPLYAATALFVLLDIARVPAAAGVPLKVLGIWLAVGWLFRETGGHSGYGLDWLRAYGDILWEDGKAALSGSWDSISAENRTVIFLAGWGLLAGVVQTILVHRRRGFWMVAATWAYLIGLQLWPGWDTSRELWASGSAGLALLAVLHLERIRHLYAPGLVRSSRAGVVTAVGAGPADPSWTSAFGSGRRGGMPPGVYAAALTVTFLIFTSALAASGSSGAARFMKPLAFDTWSKWADWFHEPGSRAAAVTEGLSPGTGAFSVRQGVTGYGQDDRTLGGPLEVLDEPVFTARTPFMTYWRGESKSFYDGSGWTAVKSAGGEAADPKELSGGEPDVRAVFVQELLFSGRRDPGVLFAGGTVESVLAMYTLDGRELPTGSLESDPETGRYEVSGGMRDRIGYARLRVREAGYPSSETGALLAAKGSVPEAVARTYLQLPAQLPERVRTLAVRTAASGATPYAKAQLIERYLKEHYRYSLTEVGVPAAGEDFVDRFLFGPEGAGYCDYFSTAMTVMLRSAGVPARWVKGFAPGTRTGEGDGLLTVNVSSKDAHSWVEAYIPGRGWVPFDPTPGFTGFGEAGSAELAEAAAALAGLDASTPPAAAEASAPAGDSARGTPMPFGAWQSAAADAWDRLAPRLGDWVAAHRLLLAAALLALGLAVWLVRTQRHLLALLLLARYRRRGRGRPALALKVLERLWLSVFRRYGPKPPDRTLREYALETGERFPDARDALCELVRLYEHVRFADDPPPRLPRSRMTELWRSLFGEETGRGRGVGL